MLFYLWHIALLFCSFAVASHEKRASEIQTDWGDCNHGNAENFAEISQHEQGQFHHFVNKLQECPLAQPSTLHDSERIVQLSKNNIDNKCQQNCLNFGKLYIRTCCNSPCFRQCNCCNCSNGWGPLEISRVHRSQRHDPSSKLFQCKIVFCTNHQYNTQCGAEWSKDENEFLMLLDDIRRFWDAFQTHIIG